MLSSIPPLVLTGSITSILISKISTRGQAAYSKAGIVVEQTIGSIRTVASFTGEKRAIQKYEKSLKGSYNSSVQEGLATGFNFGSLMFMIFSSYALALWFGSRLVIDKGYSVGDVITVIFMLLMRGMSLGQASPCMSAFAAGQAAAYKMFETINRKPKIDASDISGLNPDDIHGDIEL